MFVVFVTFLLKLFPLSSDSSKLKPQDHFKLGFSRFWKILILKHIWKCLKIFI